MKLPSGRAARPTHKMQSPRPWCRISAVAAGLLSLALAVEPLSAQNLPATAPTSLPAQVTPGTPAATAPAPAPARHAEVTYANGQLQIRADNSSLNQILRSISHVTGLKITGGVEEQRVFGSYGPAPLSTVLATLLDGTGANILLLGGSPGSPPELVLTSRTGGAEPPGPNSPTYAMYDDSVDRSTPVPPAGSGEITSPLSTSSPIDNKALTPPPSAARSPGQQLTPEMVAQELMQMQAQQDKKKKELDQKIRQEQMDQNRRLNTVPPAPNQPPAIPATPQ